MSNYVDYVNETVSIDIDSAVFRRIKRTKKSNHNIKAQVAECLEKVCVVANYVNGMDPDDDFIDSWHKNLDDIDIPSMLSFMIQPKTIKFDAGNRMDRNLQLQAHFKYMREKQVLDKDGNPKFDKSDKPVYHTVDTGIVTGDIPFSYREYRDALTELGTGLSFFDDSLPLKKVSEMRRHVDLVSVAPHACVSGYAATNGNFWPYFIHEKVADILFIKTKYGTDIDDCIDSFVDGFTVS